MLYTFQQFYTVYPSNDVRIYSCCNSHLYARVILLFEDLQGRLNEGKVDKCNFEQQYLCKFKKSTKVLRYY